MAAKMTPKIYIWLLRLIFNAIWLMIQLFVGFWGQGIEWHRNGLRRIIQYGGNPKWPYFEHHFGGHLEFPPYWIIRRNPFRCHSIPWPRKPRKGHITSEVPLSESAFGLYRPYIGGHLGKVWVALLLSMLWPKKHLGYCFLTYAGIFRGLPHFFQIIDPPYI